MITRITDMFTLFDLCTMCEVRPCASLRDGATRKQHAKKHFNAIPKLGKSKAYGVSDLVSKLGGRKAQVHWKWTASLLHLACAFSQICHVVVRNLFPIKINCCFALLFFSS